MVEHKAPRLVPPVSYSPKSIAPVAVGAAEDTGAVIVKELPGRTAAEGTRVCEIDDENWAYAPLHQIASSEIATDHKDRITDVRIVSPSDRTVPIRVRFFRPGSFLCRLEDRT